MSHGPGGGGGESPRGTWRGEGGAVSGLERAKQYIESLKMEDPQEAIPQLVEFLKNESWYLREQAAGALASFGNQAAGPVGALLQSGLWFTRAAALELLGRIGASEYLPCISGFLTDANRTIAESAAKALLHFSAGGKALAVAKILHARGSRFREHALDLLQRVDREAGTKLARLISASEFMGPEGTLSPEDEERLAKEIEDEEFGVSWASLSLSEPLPQPEKHIMQYLKERS